MLLNFFKFKGPFTPSESEENQRTSGKDQRINDKHQRKFFIWSVSTGLMKFEQGSKYDHKMSLAGE